MIHMLQCLRPCLMFFPLLTLPSVNLVQHLAFVSTMPRYSVLLFSSCIVQSRQDTLRPSPASIASLSLNILRCLKLLSKDIWMPNVVTCDLPNEPIPPSIIFTTQSKAIHRKPIMYMHHVLRPQDVSPPIKQAHSWSHPPVATDMYLFCTITIPTTLLHLASQVAPNSNLFAPTAKSFTSSNKKVFIHSCNVWTMKYHTWWESKLKQITYHTNLHLLVTMGGMQLNEPSDLQESFHSRIMLCLFGIHSQSMGKAPAAGGSYPESPSTFSSQLQPFSLLSITWHDYLFRHSDRTSRNSDSSSWPTSATEVLGPTCVWRFLLSPCP